jgi:uncharacterized protein
MHPRAQQLIEQLQLQPHPEGGFYKEVYRSPDLVQSSQNQKWRSAITDIYFLLIKGQISRFHKVCHEEIWNFYEGAPLELIQIHPQTWQAQNIHLGLSETHPIYKHCIPPHFWQAAISTGDFSLVGCTVAPGFDFEDFAFLENPTEQEQLLKHHPELKGFL